jgi:hypothetical protein
MTDARQAPLLPGGMALASLLFYLVAFRGFTNAGAAIL